MGYNSAEDGMNCKLLKALPGLDGCAQAFQSHSGQQQASSQMPRSKPVSVRMTSFLLVLHEGLLSTLPSEDIFTQLNVCGH